MDFSSAILAASRRHWEVETQETLGHACENVGAASLDPFRFPLSIKLRL